MSSDVVSQPVRDPYGVLGLDRQAIQCLPIGAAADVDTVLAGNVNLDLLRGGRWQLRSSRFDALTDVRDVHDILAVTREAPVNR